MKNYTYDQLPSFMKNIDERLDRMEELLTKAFSTKISDEEYISAKAALALLKFTLSTLYSKVFKREIPFYKQGNRLYFSRIELLDWVKDGRRKTLIDIDISADKIINRMNKKVIKNETCPCSN